MSDAANYSKCAKSEHLASSCSYTILALLREKQTTHDNRNNTAAWWQPTCVFPMNKRTEIDESLKVVPSDHKEHRRFT